MGSVGAPASFQPGGSSQNRVSPPSSHRTPGGRQGSQTSESPPEPNTNLQIAIPRQFGEADEYWKYYEEIANRHDEDMVKVLGDKLDSLLVFAGLFSSVNTALIVFTFDMLRSPDAQTVTLLKLIALGKTSITPADMEPPRFVPPPVAVRVNCCFGASLACSLLVSFGAVLAKQWVSHFAHNHPGTLEAQGRRRQRKLNGVTKYYFRGVIEFLPVLLQITLITFVAGIIDFLHSLNKIVAKVMIAFCTTGIAAYVVTGIFATLDPECPFQTPISLLFRHVYILGRDCGAKIRYQCRGSLERRRERAALTQSDILLRAVDTHMPPVPTPAEMNERYMEQRGVRDHLVDIDTASWTLETSEHTNALLATAKNIPALRTVQGTRLAQGRLAYLRLDSLFRDALTNWSGFSGRASNRATSALEATLIYGRALAHCTIGGPSAAFKYKTAPPSHAIWSGCLVPSTSHTDVSELFLLKFCLDKDVRRDFCINHIRGLLPRRSAALPIYLAAILEPSPSESKEKVFRVSATSQDRIVLVQWLTHMSCANEAISSPTVVNLSAWSLGKLPGMISGLVQELRGEWWEAYTTDKNLFKNVLRVLRIYQYYQRLESASQHTGVWVVRGYSTLLQPILYTELFTDLLRTFTKVIGSGEFDHKLLRERTFELDGTLRQLRVTASRRRESPGTGDDESKQLERLEEAINKTIICLCKVALGVTFREPPNSVHHNARTPRIPPFGTIKSFYVEMTADGPKKERVHGIVEKLGKAPYAALAVIHDKATEWFKSDADGPQFHRLFKEAGLLPALQRSMDSEENLPLISGIIVKLMNSSLWVGDIMGERLVDRFLERGRSVLGRISYQPIDADSSDTGGYCLSFQKLECIFNVRKEFKSHEGWLRYADSGWNDSAKYHTRRFINHFSGLKEADVRPVPPYIPESFLEYVEEMIGEDTTNKFRQAYDRLMNEADAVWFTTTPANAPLSLEPIYETADYTHQAANNV
ncbi:hypothetical protein FRB99_006548 [Tulasnella sp. 403]|nr:hypothetical protein FRB99_006548 [Tulasnella sp. 403]